MFYSHEGWYSSLLRLAVFIVFEGKGLMRGSSHFKEVRRCYCLVGYTAPSSLLRVDANHNGRLVATLGSKSNGKKINRKAIFNVDVPKACQTIIDPEAPMALRLQGNLL